MSIENDNMICKVCEGLTKEIFKTEVLGKYTVSYFRCSVCNGRFDPCTNFT